jgi:uncharacterized protein DUF6232
MLLYESADLLVTDKAVTSRSERYRIDDLAYVRVVVYGQKAAAAIAGRVGAVLLAVVFGVWAVVAPSDRHTVFATVLLASSVVGGACIRVTPRRHEIWAVHGRRDVCLFTTTDERVFGQVRRALMRAMEHRRARYQERGGWTEIAA